MSSGNSFVETGVSLFDWSFEDHKAFECALAMHFDKDDRWDRIAASVPNKTPQDVHNYFLMLEDDVRRIEMGQVPVPTYELVGQPFASMVPPPGGQALQLIDMPQQALHTTPSKSKPNTPGSNNKKGGNKGGTGGLSGGVSKPKAQQQLLVDALAVPPPPPAPGQGGVASPGGDRRKGVPWTEEEHRLFLLGLAKFGKGDWRSIARTFVTTRTPTQVASHAQKYFIRLNSANKKDKRRASIHDITSASLTPIDLHRGHSDSLDQQLQQHEQQQQQQGSRSTKQSKAAKPNSSKAKQQQQQHQQHQQHLLPPLPPPLMGSSLRPVGEEDYEEEEAEEDDGDMQHLQQHHQHPQHHVEEDEDDSIELQQQDVEQQEDVGFGNTEDQDEVVHGVHHGMVSDMGVDDDDMHHHHYPLHHHFEGMIMPELMLEQDAY